MFSSSSPIPPSAHRDRAAVTAPTVMQIVFTSSTAQVMQQRIENFLRDEFHDIARPSRRESRRSRCMT
jgi:hypothetical protein